MAIHDFSADRNPTSDEPAGGGSSGGGTMDGRVARLETAVEGLRGDVRGLRHSQNIAIVAVVGVGAILFTAIVFLGNSTLNRIDYTLNRIDALPAELNAIANSIANAINATRSDRPIVINIPAMPQSQDAAPSNSEKP